jgi:DNA transformation protein
MVVPDFLRWGCRFGALENYSEPMSSALAEHCIELLGGVGAARARRMFGGHGLYVDDLFVAVIVDERLYLKADALTQPAFEAAGCERWVYLDKGKSIAMSYWSVPAEAMESLGLMQPWARLAIAAALRARSPKAAAAPRNARAAKPKPKATVARKKA